VWWRKEEKDWQAIGGEKIRKEKKSKELPSHNELSEGFMLGLAQGLSEDIGPV
jgi:hypothetical protein